MRYALLALLAASVSAAAPVSAQTAHRTAEQMKADYDVHRGDFDYLLRDWEFTAVSREYGRFRGLWSAVRLPDGQLLDEYRVVRETGETTYLTTTLRAYNAALEQWELVGMDRGNGLQDIGTARRVGSEMHLEQKLDVNSSSPYTMRIRYFNIQPDRFSWAGDRSIDDGKSWVKDFIQIEARRIGPARSMGPVALFSPASSPSRSR